MPPKKLKVLLKAKGKLLYKKKLEKRQREAESLENYASHHPPSLPPPPPPPVELAAWREDVITQVGERPFDIRKRLLNLGKGDSVEGERLILLKEKRLDKLVKCIGQCDDCCGEVSLTSRYEHFEVFLLVKCKDCDKVLYADEPEKVSEKLETKREVYDSNLRMVYSSMVNDIGNSGLMKHCAVVGVPHFSERQYQKYKEVICKTDIEKGKLSRKICSVHFQVL